MSKEPILIAGEPLHVLDASIPSLETEHCGGSIWRVSWPTDTEQGAAWARAVERYAADMLTVDRQDPLEKRLAAALLLISAEIASAKPTGV